MPNIGPVELIIVLVIVLIVFGARRVPEAGRNIGKGMREFKDAITGKDEDRKELSASGAASTPAQSQAAESAAPEAQPAADAEPAREPETAAHSGEPRG